MRKLSHIVCCTCFFTSVFGCSSAPSTGAPPGTGAGGDQAAGGTGNVAGDTSGGGDNSVAGSAGNAPTGGNGGSSVITGGAGGGGNSNEPDGSTAGPFAAAPDFGPNVLIFDPSMASATIQAQLDGVIGKQNTDQFSTQRWAYFFKPGAYTVDVKLGFYMQALGLGAGPDDVQITGAVRSKADWLGGGNATLNFWRAAENLSVTPTQDKNVDIWAVSQGTSFRRMHVKGGVALADGGYSSGGFIANSQVDGPVASGSQQQFFTRNDTWAGWNGGVWNMVFVGDSPAPQGTWPTLPYTVVPQTPLVREKPYLSIDAQGHYFVMRPKVKASSSGNDWKAGASAPVGAFSTDLFYIAKPATDTSATINAALASGKHLLLTPGIYHLEESLQVSHENTIVFGLGLATLVPNHGTPVLSVADVDGVTVSGIVVDAGSTNAETLIQVGAAGSSQSHATNPTSLHDVSCRVGGATAGTATSCLTINSSNVLGDNLWMWRADHGAGAGWTGNVSKNGVIVNGNDVTIYGLFVEHFQEYQTLWNGNGGSVYFYQSELPYDPPSQAAWQHDGVNGFASYKVAAAVTTHHAFGLGSYCVFHNNVSEENSVETPTGSGIVMQHLMTSWLNGTGTSVINHIINGTGNAASQANRQAFSAN